MTPLVKMHTLGSGFVPEPIHAGGLRYHGMSPLVSLLKEEGHIEARSVTTGVLRGPASCSPAARASCRRRSRPTPSRWPSTRRSRPRRPVSRGSSVQHVRSRPLRPDAYQRYLDGSLEDYEYPAEAVEAALAVLPKV